MNAVFFSDTGPCHTGPITASFENLGNNTFANAEFSTIAVRPSAVPEFSLVTTVYATLFVLMILVQTIFKRLSQNS